MNQRLARRRPDKEVRRLMQKFDELTQGSVLLQNVFIKMWKLLVKAQHRHEVFPESWDGRDKETKSQNRKASEKAHDGQQKQDDGVDGIRNPAKLVIEESRIPTMPVDIQIYI